MKEPGQVVLFRFPRADLSEGKLRPALLLSEVPGPYEDWLICMISSQVHQRIDGFDELIEEGDEDFARSGLKVTSVIRIGRLAVVEGGLLEGRMGTINPERMIRIVGRIIPNATIHHTCSRHSEGACDRGISSMLAETIAVEHPFFTPLPRSSERLFVAPLL